jgi:hypothetical protein
MGSYIIGFIVFVAFARAAREYQKSVVAWGLIGVAAFFVSQFAIGFLGAIILRMAGATSALSLLLIGDFVASVVITGWTYKKLMDGAIREMAARDAAASVSAASGGR